MKWTSKLEKQNLTNIGGNVTPIQYTSLQLWKLFMDLINFKLYVEFIVPLFKREDFSPIPNRKIWSLRKFNVVLKKVRVKLVLLRLKLITEAEKMAELAMSAKDQITKQMDSSLKPKIEVLLAKKAKPHLIFMLWTSHLWKYLRISLYHWGYVICQKV